MWGIKWKIEILRNWFFVFPCNENEWKMYLFTILLCTTRYRSNKGRHASVPCDVLRQQVYKDMSLVTKEFSNLLPEDKIVHGDNPVLRWMSRNAIVETDAVGNIKVKKVKSLEKTDDIVAAIMALDRAVRNEGSLGSIYDKRGIIAL